MDLSTIFNYLQQTVTQLQTYLSALNTIGQQLHHIAAEFWTKLGGLLG